MSTEVDDNPRGETPEQQEFRAYCRSWIAGYSEKKPPFHPAPPGPLEIETVPQMDWYRGFQRAAYDAGLIGCDYPKECGGGGRTDCQRIANDELQSARAPHLPNIIGLGMAAPTILNHGTPEQKERFMKRLFSAEDIWCQGFSEPGAGSDLASVQTRARREGDTWIINGHKVWTSLAQFADWMILLCRTESSNKYGGLTYFICPIKSALGKGVTVRPLVKITGEKGFNEVLFEDLELPDNLRLDAEGKGWAVAMTTLLHERGAGPLVTPTAGGRLADASDALGASGLIKLAKKTSRDGKRVSDDALFRDQIMDLFIRQRCFDETRKLSLVQGFTEQHGRLELQHKLLLSEQIQDVTELACSIEGMASTFARAGGDVGRYALAYQNSYGFTIAAGTSEVQRNILGERVLGLPKSK